MPRFTAVAGAALLTLALQACAADPGPPPLVQQEELDRLDPTTTSAAEAARPERSEIRVGAQPLRGGLNPHLLSDDTSVVQSIADLTLPSAYLNGEPNRDVVLLSLIHISEPTRPY